MSAIPHADGCDALYERVFGCCLFVRAVIQWHRDWRRLMKEFFICECHLQENKVITSSFVVASKQVKPKKNGEPYLALTLADRTGQIEAKMWDNVEEVIDPFYQDEILK